MDRAHHNSAEHYGNIYVNGAERDARRKEEKEEKKH